MMAVERPLHLIIIDAWHPDVVQAELEGGQLPALRHLLRHGHLDPQCTSIFPTVTPACLTSLATGVGPDQHGITGVFWYNRAVDRYVHYWPYPQSLLWGTVDHVIEDFFLRMNREHLSAEVHTVFELLEAADVPSACINFPVSRGPYQHVAELPWLLGRLGRRSRELSMPGPRYMRHGDMIRHGQPRAHMLGRYGFSDRQGARYTAEMVRRHRPKFLLTYLNENDLRSHHKGPENTGGSLRQIDRELGTIMDAYGSWDRAVQEARWILTGDHAQSNTYPHLPGRAVNVFKAFPKHRVAPMRDGGLERSAHDFAVCPNDRMCYFYFGEGKAHLRDEVLGYVSSWPSVDQIFWRDGETFHAFRRATGESMGWRRGGPLVDRYGDRWDVWGSPGAVDATITGNRLTYRDYPNALARATEALTIPNGGTALMTATLGYEFTSGFPMGRGNHGSLHAQDSYVPLVTVGLQHAPFGARTVDVVPMILRELGVALPAYLQPAAPVPYVREA